MKTTYLIWKNPSCAGINPDWQEITGQEFYALVHSAEAKERYFIKLPSSHTDGSDGAFVMEATKPDYLKWKSEKNHADYLNRDANPFKVLSYHAMESEDGDSYGEELLVGDVDIEADYIKSLEPEMIRAAIELLDEKEYQVIQTFFLSSEICTEQEAAEKIGISQQLLNYRKKVALKKLKKIFES